MSALPSVCGQWEFQHDSKTNRITATKKSLCCLAKFIVAFKQCLLIKTQQKSITGCSVCKESHHTTPIKLPFTWKPSPDNSSFSGAALPASLRLLLNRTGPLRVCVRLLCHCWDKLVPGASHFFPRMPALVPAPGLWLCPARQYVCQIEESPSVTRLSSFLWGKWKTSLTALLIDLDPSLQCLDSWLLVLSHHPLLQTDFTTCSFKM